MNNDMDYSCVIDGNRTDDTGRLRALLIDETEGSRSPSQVDPVAKVQELLDGGRTAQLLGLTPERIREMSPIERRLLLDFGVRRIEEFERKVGLLSRTMAVGEISVPDYLRQKAAV